MVNIRTFRRVLALMGAAGMMAASGPAAGAEGKFFLLKSDRPVNATQTARVVKKPDAARNAYAAASAAGAKNPYNAKPEPAAAAQADASGGKFLSLAKAQKRTSIGRVGMPATARRQPPLMQAARAAQKETETGVSTARLALRDRGDDDVRVVSRSRRAPVAAVTVNELDDDLETAEGVESDEQNPIAPLVMEPAGRVKHFWPVDLAAEQRISSPFGWRKHPVTGRRSFHTGVDIAAASGTRVLASAQGVVSETGQHRNLGNYVRIEHADGTMSVYGHLARIATRKGAAVKSGQVIGMIGSTGRSTGPHLHYTLKQDDNLVDPLKRLKKPEPAKVFAAKVP